jgi:hypothetical protein
MYVHTLQRLGARTLLSSSFALVDFLLFSSKTKLLSNISS